MTGPGERTVRLAVPGEVHEIARVLEGAGFETWCVGGAVRDALLGRRHLDWDLATAATPPQVKRLFRRTIPVGEAFGTIGVLDRQGRLHEVTTFRRDVHTDGRHAVVEFGASLDEDLARRDFTINAIAYGPRSGRLHDPFGGRDDLARGVVRAVGEPGARMREDRLRALRALRFAGRFGFRIEPATWAAIVDSAPHLPRLSRERVRQELEKSMEQVVRPSEAILLWRRAGALRVLVPALDEPPESRFHAADAVALPDAAPTSGRKRRRTLLRLATLLVGLPHEAVVRTLRDLRFSNRDVEWLAALAGHAAALAGPLGDALTRADAVGDGTLRRWAALTGRTRLADVLRVAGATWSAGASPDPHAGASAPLRARGHALYRRAVRVAYRDPVEVADLAVDGEDLMREAGIAPGPALGLALRALRDAVVEAPHRNTRETLVALARAGMPEPAQDG